LSSLISELTDRARLDIEQKLSTSDKIITQSMDPIVISKKLSSEIGTEAKEVSLSLNLKIEVPTFNEKDLIDILKRSITVPPGYIFDENKTNLSVINTKLDKNGDISATVLFTSYLLPEFDLAKIKSSITGKRFTEIEHILSENKNIGSIEIIDERYLSFLINNRLPFRGENISILTVSR
jgi:hypothetical protein